MSALIGAPVDRVDGVRKVTGTANYTGDVAADRVVHGVLVLSTIAKGRITRIDEAAARAVPGVIQVITHANAPRVKTEGRGGVERTVRVLQDDRVLYDREPVAVVLADSLEAATEGAAVLRVEYAAEQPVTTMDAGEHVPVDEDDEPELIRGDAETAFAAAPVQIDAMYSTPMEHHNPLEPHATLAEWNGSLLTVHESTQGVFSARKRFAEIFALPLTDVRIVAKFIGGGFGSKGTVWPHAVLAAMAARMLARPVKIVLERSQMFGSVGYRPETRQRVALGAETIGALTSTIHEVTSQTSIFDDFTESATAISKMLYASPTAHTKQILARTNQATPTFMRGPGESSGSFALESAMDELAYATQLDPIDLRLRNYAETDPSDGRAYSSKSLRECYRVGAQAFGWSQRTSEPRSMRAGRMLVGYGMATATYPTYRSGAAAQIRINSDGSASVQSGGADIGTGAYTVFTQVAAEFLGIALERVHLDLGDTLFPLAPIAGGSMLTASVASAIKVAALDARGKVIAHALADQASPLHGASPTQISAADGRLFVTGDPTRGETYAAILRRCGSITVEGNAQTQPGLSEEKYAMHAFGAQFAEVHVDPDLGEVRVARFTGAFACGRILNAKTARSQFLGGITWGIGMALTEHTRLDERSGRIMTANLSDYLIPVHADVPHIETILVPEDDALVNEVGVKGIGEIGIVGVAAAIANAVYHATGKRIRDLPITPDKLL
jgi:xanthine dehydrogenase YagR molybdenum-binding subunit